ncbi:MAG: ASCH domain-containing protein [Malacoplasma sp.]|nr:ASCH domain-containing protein [Malacoplasma sp.]
MKKILISIKPEYVKNILKGIKKYEYRTKLPKEKISKIIIYCTSPIKKVVAEVDIL